MNDSDIEMAEAARAADEMAVISRLKGIPFDPDNPEHLRWLLAAAGDTTDSWGSRSEETILGMYEQHDVVMDFTDAVHSRFLFDALMATHPDPERRVHWRH